MRVRPLEELFAGRRPGKRKESFDGKCRRPRRRRDPAFSVVPSRSRVRHPEAVERGILHAQYREPIQSMLVKDPSLDARE